MIALTQRQNSKWSQNYSKRTHKFQDCSAFMFY